MQMARNLGKFVLVLLAMSAARAWAAGEDVDAINSLLHGCGGWDARLWDFAATHDRLVIELWNRVSGDRRYLLLLGCSHLSVPTGWKLQNAMVIRDENSYVFRDGEVAVHFAYEAQVRAQYAR